MYISPDKLLELERFAEIGRLNASLLHEISNPLTAAMLWLEQYENRHSPNIRHVRRSIRLLQRYVEAARQQIRRESEYRNFRVQPEIEQVKQVLVPLARHKGVRLRFGQANGYKLHGDPVKFQQIIANLVNNAIDSYETVPGRDNKTVVVSFRKDQDFLLIGVSDKGCGMTDKQLSRIFQPFYSTKSKTGRGVGIGLSVIKSYVETGFRGGIQVDNRRRQGTRFVIRLRMAPPSG